MKQRTARYLLWFSLALISGCEYNFPDPVPAADLDPGNADFSRIAVLGGELGAGYMDGSLYSEGQGNSIGAILSRQINQNNQNPITFQQPDIDSENGFNPSAAEPGVRGKYYLKYLAPGEQQIFKDTDPGELPGSYSGPALNNFSLPYLRTPEVLQAELSNFNPYYNRFASNPGTSTLINEMLALQPTLSIVQLGWYDVLAYASYGLTGNTDPDKDDINLTDLTPLDLFKSSYQEIIDLLLQQTDGEIILINIPDVSKFPFFNSVSNRAFVNGEEVVFLAGFYRDYNIQVSMSNSNQQILRPTIQFFADDPPHLWRAVVDDPDLVDRTQEDGSPLPKWRQLDEGEYISWAIPVLPSLEGDGLGTTLPLDKSLFFTPSDFEQIVQIVGEFNQIIDDIAVSDPRLDLFDWFSISEMWAEDGVTFDGVLHTYDFERSGMFSSDATNMNSRGSALFTNKLIEYINQQFGSNVPLVNPNTLPGNVFVNDF